MAQQDITASTALTGRVVPAIAAKFMVKEIPATESKDVFEIESKGDSK